MPNDAPLIDCHCHTEMAYCATDVTAQGAIERSRKMCLTRLYLTEHAPQLYVLHETFWQGRHILEPHLWREKQQNRMPQYRELVDPLRSDFVGVGLEVELDCENVLTLHDEDRDIPDILVGAIHWVNQNIKGWTYEQRVGLFMDNCRVILEAGVDILAHPWRFFRRAEMPVPAERYAELADMLAQTNTAVEVNFHINEPEVAFFAECIARGVKISFGTDSHQQEGPGELAMHIAFVRQVAGRDDVADLLYMPPIRG